jgi:hypothetical protein
MHSASDAYSSVAGLTTQAHHAAPVSHGATLPFTGFELVAVAVAGLVLLALGLALSRLTARPE